MNKEQKTRKREPNFTSVEKAVLANLIKKYPQIESKRIDNQSIQKKKQAWCMLTSKYNSNPTIMHIRDTLTLKRAWDNMKAYSRKSRPITKGNLIKTGGGPGVPQQPPQEALVTTDEEAAPAIICKIENQFDSDGVVLEVVQIEDQVSTDSSGTHMVEEDSNSHVRVNNEETNTGMEVDKLPAEHTRQQSRRPSDYLKKEAVMRIRHLGAKHKMELNILKEKLETAQKENRAASLKVERENILLENAKLELEELRNK